MRLLIFICFIYGFINYGSCGDIGFSHTPPGIRIGAASSSIRLSDLDKILSSILGYSTGKESLIWNGLTVISPFGYPSAAIVFAIQSGGVPVSREGIHYATKEDTNLNEVFKHLTSRISNQAQRPVHFEHADASNLIDEDIRPISLSYEHLKKDREFDATFLHQMGLLSTIADRVKEVSSVSHRGQDVIFINIDSFSNLVKHYGENSEQVKEAVKILRMALSQVEDRFTKLYGDKFLFVTTMIDNEEPIRKRRSLLATPDDYELNPKATSEDANIADEYSDDFPVMFNIVLFLAIVLIMALIAISVEMATMDPGRDSIIYRMTNPRMKKDQ